jgi:hypothetical protein
MIAGEEDNCLPGVPVVGGIDHPIIADGVTVPGINHADTVELDVGGNIGLLALPGLAGVAGELDLAAVTGCPADIFVNAIYTPIATHAGLAANPGDAVVGREKNARLDVACGKAAAWRRTGDISNIGVAHDGKWPEVVTIFGTQEPAVGGANQNCSAIAGPPR